MEEIKNFETFYAVAIEPSLASFRQTEKEVRQWKTAAMLAAIVFVLSAFASVAGIASVNFNPVWIGAAALLIISTYKFYRKENSLVDDYKERVVKTIIEYLGAGLEYKPDLTIPQREYVQSGLYRRNYDYYEGDDLIKGAYKGVSFHCSELHTKRDDYMPRNNIATIFKGLFFAAAVNARYTGGTYIWLKGHEQLGASIADEEYRLLPFPSTRHIQTGNTVFDDIYTVYTTNPTEARAIVNEGLQNDLLKFRQQVKRNVTFSVVMGKCYAAIPVKVNLFEVPEDLGSKEEIKKHFFTVLLVLSIINQLNLKKLV